MILCMPLDNILYRMLLFEWATQDEIWKNIIRQRTFNMKLSLISPRFKVRFKIFQYAAHIMELHNGNSKILYIDPNLIFRP